MIFTSYSFILPALLYYDALYKLSKTDYFGFLYLSLANFIMMIFSLKNGGSIIFVSAILGMIAFYTFVVNFYHKSFIKKITHFSINSFIIDAFIPTVILIFLFTCIPKIIASHAWLIDMPQISDINIYQACAYSTIISGMLLIANYHWEGWFFLFFSIFFQYITFCDILKEFWLFGIIFVIANALIHLYGFWKWVSYEVNKKL